MPRYQQAIRAACLAGMAWCSPQVTWAIPVSGVFTAERACPAYVSKNKQTNPDAAEIAVGQVYTVLEANRLTEPEWYRIRLTSANPRERWVNTQCGRFQPSAPTESGSAHGTLGTTCNLAGQANSYTLALSWQPAFCESKPEKAECRLSDPAAYSARNFTLHGLWPNRQECGTDYGFCGEVKQAEQNFCDYPAVRLQTASHRSLAEVMPSVEAGSCLERHEWYKHGTCQTEWSQDEYFAIAADLTRQFNEAGMAYFMNRKLGREVQTESFLARLDGVFGRGTREKVELDCKNGMLQEIRMSLPRDLRLGVDLETLLMRATPRGGSACGVSFRVDPTGPSAR